MMTDLFLRQYVYQAVNIDNKMMRIHNTISKVWGEIV